MPTETTEARDKVRALAAAQFLRGALFEITPEFSNQEIARMATALIKEVDDAQEEWELAIWGISFVHMSIGTTTPRIKTPPQLPAAARPVLA